MFFREFFNLVKAWGFEYFGLFYGHYFGQIVDIDDPEGMGRVRAECDTLWGPSAPETIWCIPGYGPTGDGSGVWWPPKVGDHVWITCRYGQADAPEYRGGWWTKAKKPDYTNDQRGLITPAGWKLIFDDENEVAEISSPNEKVKFELNHASGSVVVTAPTGVTLDSEKISLGSDAASEPVPLGTALVTWLGAHTHLSAAPSSPSGPPINIADLSNTLSTKVFGE